MKTYVITGASSEIGIAYLKSLEEHGEDVVAYCQYHSNDAELKELQTNFRNVELRLTRCDLSSLEDAEHWVTCMKSDGILPTHILHLAAKKFHYTRMKQFDYQGAISFMNVQVNSFAQLCKAFFPAMQKAKYGRVAVMLSSCTIGVPPKFMSDYVMTKYALLGLMKSVASEYSGTGITVNGLSPGMIETKFLSDIDPRVIEMTADKNPMKRNVRIDEVIHALRFLLSDDVGYMNGVNLNLSGGEFI